MAEIKLKAIKGEIHHTLDVQKVVTDMLINFKQKMRAIPTKIATQINPASKTSVIEAKLKKEIDEALTELSEYKAEDYYSSEFIKIDEDNEKMEENNNNDS